MTKTLIIVATAICIIQSTSNRIFAQMKVLANWRFEQIKHLEGDSLSIATIGEPLTATDRGPSEPQPYVYDNSGNANYLQVRGSRKSPIVFSNDVPGNVKDGNSNTRSLSIKRGELIVNFDKAIAYNDMQKAWSIEASLKCNLLGTEQVFLCKEGAPGQLAGDVSIGYDNTEKRYFVELFKNNWYFFYHDGAYELNNTPGGDCRRQVCVEHLYFSKDGSIKPIALTTEGISAKPKKQ